MALGIQHPDYLEMDSRQLDEWLQFHNQEPWGYKVAEFQLAALSSTVGNFSGRAKRLLSPKDFLPKEKTEGGFVDKLKAHFKALANGCNDK